MLWVFFVVMKFGNQFVAVHLYYIMVFSFGVSFPLPFGGIT